MPSVTQQTYFRRVLDRLYPHRYQRYGTGTATTTTTLTDATAFATSFTQTSALIGTWIRISSATTVEYAKIAAVSAGGVITFDRTLTAAMTGALPWELTYERHPDSIEKMIDAVLENTYTPRLFPLTSFYAQDVGVDDNDMEVSTATAWSGTATPTKASIIAPYPHGIQQLNVDGGADQYVANASTWYVTAGHQYFASVSCSTKVSDRAEFQIYDSTNSAEIEDATTVEQAWVNLSFYFTPPTNCEQIQARLICPDASCTNYWRDISVINCDQKIFQTPYWLTKERQMIGVLEMPLGPPGPTGNNEYRLDEIGLRAVTWRPALSGFRSTNEVAIQVETFRDSPRFIYAFAPSVALSLNSSVAYVDVDVVAENATRLIEIQEAEGGRAAMWKHLARIREQSLASDVPMPEERGVAYFA